MRINLSSVIILLCTLIACQTEKISLDTNADDFFYLQENGNSMPIQVHGNIASNKIVLIIHGGPGDNSIGYRDTYVTTNVEKEFAIAYWDQRLAGSSQGNSTSTDIKLYKKDLKKVVQLLLSRYGSDKRVYVMGHSWGGLITPYFLEENNNQDLVKGWIQVDGAHNYFMNDSLTKEMLLEYSKKEIALGKNQAKWQEIMDYCNAHAFNESIAVADQLNIYAGTGASLLDYIQKSTPTTLIQDATANNVSASSYLINSKITTRKKLSNQAYSLTVSQGLYKIKIPTLLLWGKYDFVCPVGLANDIKNNIGSSDVTEKIFAKSAHSPMFNEPKEFWDAVITWVDIH
ncbi:MAG: alpha/beta fold hydrolase [Leadbetterella sp.]